MDCKIFIHGFLTSLVVLVGNASLAQETAPETIKDCDACPEMVVVRAGTFTMGSSDSEEGRDEEEGPQHQVAIHQPFAIGKFEVTFTEWDACVEAGACRDKLDDNGWGRGRQPVINASWDDALIYVGWLSETTGKTYRLPSEAEWEYVARAGTSTPFATGQTITTDQANFDGRKVYGGSQKGIARRKTVGSPGTELEFAL